MHSGFLLSKNRQDEIYSKVGYNKRNNDTAITYGSAIT